LAAPYDSLWLFEPLLSLSLVFLDQELFEFDHSDLFDEHVVFVAFIYFIVVLNGPARDSNLDGAWRALRLYWVFRSGQWYDVRVLLLFAFLNLVTRTE